MALLSLYRRISSLDSLSPSPRVNKLFTELVKSATSSKNLEKLTSKELASLQSLASAAEYELENYWAKKIIKSPNPSKALLEFPYYSNYEKLTQLEWHALLGCSTHATHSVLFVGGGPLPLTAIILAQKYGCEITILDNNPAAYEIATQLIKSLNLGKVIKVQLAEGEQFLDYKAFNVIYVAALAGLDQKAKNAILNQIKAQISPQAHVLARSSWGNRRLLYRPLGKTAYKYLTPILEVHPHTDVVNSVVIFKSGTQHQSS